jgi:hypothetical protein
MPDDILMTSWMIENLSGTSIKMAPLLDYTALPTQHILDCHRRKT